jgi:uncharacterized protein YlxW (UPF0749 family)
VKQVDKKYVNFIWISIIIGFMLAVQFRTVQEPTKIRDTRDTWQLREDYLREKAVYSKLLEEIRSIEDKLAKYETERKQSKEQILRETLNELKAEAGLTEVTGPGITLQIERAYEDMILGESASSITPDSLKRLINELNMSNALYISVDGQRIVNTTVIRDINGVTKIDGHSLDDLPIEIKVIVESIEQAEKLYNGMLASQSAEELYRFESLRLNVSKPAPDITVPAYQKNIRILHMEQVETKEGGSK